MAAGPAAGLRPCQSWFIVMTGGGAENQPVAAGRIPTGCDAGQVLFMLLLQRFIRKMRNFVTTESGHCR